MPGAMPGSNARSMLGAKHATNATNERNERLQATHKNRSVPNAPTPVDNGVSLTLPTHIWGRLASVAEARGVKVADIIVAALRPLLAPQTLNARVVELARAGFTDTHICEATGQDRSFVARTRRSAGIPANKPQRSNA
jgi:hypothetical protein